VVPGFGSSSILVDDWRALRSQEYHHHHHGEGHQLGHDPQLHEVVEAQKWQKAGDAK